jgi:hypothetical protein
MTIDTLMLENIMLSSMGYAPFGGVSNAKMLGYLEIGTTDYDT